MSLFAKNGGEVKISYFAIRVHNRNNKQKTVDLKFSKNQELGTKN